MINEISLWHVTPVHIGTEFFDATTSVLDANEELYNLVNSYEQPLSPKNYNKNDLISLKRMRDFLHELKENSLKSKEYNIVFHKLYPNIAGCIAKFEITANMFCYIMCNGTAVFLDYGEPIEITDEKYFSIPAFYKRQVYEDDYCISKEETPRKKPLYYFLNLLWESMGSASNHYSSSKDFRNNGVSYTLCIAMIDAPSLVANNLDESIKKNINAMMDTTPFNHVYNKEQWPLIKQRIDEYTTINPRLKELSENLIFVDDWSGVIVAGDLRKNENCITWFMEFEIILQSNWLLFDAYCENALRQDLSSIELQSMINRVEFMKISLDNDISSNMEQSRHIMRNSLIESSDINVIYSRMYGILENKLNLRVMSDDKKKSKFALLSDISLLVIAILEIYGVINELVNTNSFGKDNLLVMAIMTIITIGCIWIMVKGRS